MASVGYQIGYKTFSCAFIINREKRKGNLEWTNGESVMYQGLKFNSFLCTCWPMRNKEIVNNLKPSRLLISSGKMHQITYSVGHQSHTVVNSGEGRRGDLRFWITASFAPRLNLWSGDKWKGFGMNGTVAFCFLTFYHQSSHTWTNYFFPPPLNVWLYNGWIVMLNFTECL